MYGKRTFKLFQKKRSNSNSNSPPKIRPSVSMSNAQKAFNERERQRRLNKMRQNRLKQMFPNNFSNSNNNNNVNMFGVNLGNGHYFKVGNNKISLHSMKGALLLPTHKSKVSSQKNIVNWWKSNNARNFFKNSIIFVHPISKKEYMYKNFVLV